MFAVSLFFADEHYQLTAVAIEKSENTFAVGKIFLRL